jgi:2-polyprenyl-3-methyl-5-hydroxy-6-metoxy-1,4-benzoquinol methylase
MVNKNIHKEEFLKIEREFHDNYAQKLNWDSGITDFLSYEDELFFPVENYFIEKLGNVNHKKILDIGSGFGNNAFNLAKKGAEVTSIDISKEIIKGCKKRAKINNTAVDFKVMDACNLEFEENTFDLIV